MRTITFTFSKRREPFGILTPWFPGSALTLDSLSLLYSLSLSPFPLSLSFISSLRPSHPFRRPRDSLLSVLIWKFSPSLSEVSESGPWSSAASTLLPLPLQFHPYSLTPWPRRRTLIPISKIRLSCSTLSYTWVLIGDKLARERHHWPTSNFLAEIFFFFPSVCVPF